MHLIVLLPFILVVYLLIIDFIDLYPFNDVTKRKGLDRMVEFINYCLFAGIALYSWLELPGYLWAALLCSALGLLGFTFAWIVPYFCGHFSDESKREYEFAFGKTIKILPPIKGNPIPDLEHMPVGILLLAWFVAVLCKFLG